MNIPESLHEQDTQAVSYPGEVLARAREAKGLSQEYVAGKLYLRVKMIEHIERDQYDDMPQPVFVQGYIRAYAKLLGLAPELLLERYSAIREPEKKSSERILRQKQKEYLYRDGKSRWLMIGSGVVVALLAYYWWAYHGKYLSSVEPVAVQTTHEAGIKEEKQASASPLIDLSSMESNLSLKTDPSTLRSTDD